MRPEATSSHLSFWDILFTITMHLLVVVLVVLWSWWHNAHPPEKKQLKRVEVSMISSQELRRLQHPPAHKKTPVKKSRPQPKPVNKPQALPKLTPVKPSIQPHLQPKVKATPKPRPVRHVKPKKAVKEEPGFDPFAPVQSSSDVATNKPRKARTDLAQLMQQQLSQKEIEQYIRMMQQSVQRHWKVPGGIADNLPDPLVEMTLKPNGDVARVRIIESSGDAVFDQTLLEAIHAAAPFTIPQQQFESFRTNRIRFHPL